MLVFILIGQAVLGLSDGTPFASSRIHGGEDAPPAYSPHMVALLAFEPRVRVVCGGSIISVKHVLTAAHCLTPFIVDEQLAPSFHGRVGSNYWHSGGTLIYFESHHVHPEWNEDIIKYDVGVLETTQDITLSDTVAVIGLEFGWVDGGEASFVTGWGTTWPRFDENVVHLAPTPYWLQLLYLSTLSFNNCREIIEGSEEWLAVAPPLDERVEICTFHSVGYGMCHGDSGSALVSARSGRQIGVVSWGMPCARGAPDFYTRISPYLEYLRPILGQHMPQF